uniref:Uncharacterized protein n=1 Tax=Ananas comosus var. bracteatus TaxID=296719 RepID=A0A6V7QHL7_ANACO|nr:unnamed protein product [Ananas comosus var. bracteatus]
MTELRSVRFGLSVDGEALDELDGGATRLRNEHGTVRVDGGTAQLRSGQRGPWSELDDRCGSASERTRGPWSELNSRCGSAFARRRHLVEQKATSRSRSGQRRGKQRYITKSDGNLGSLGADRPRWRGFERTAAGGAASGGSAAGGAASSRGRQRAFERLRPERLRATESDELGWSEEADDLCGTDVERGGGQPRVGEPRRFRGRREAT